PGLRARHDVATVNHLLAFIRDIDYRWIFNGELQRRFDVRDDGGGALVREGALDDRLDLAAHVEQVQGAQHVELKHRRDRLLLAALAGGLIESLLTITERLRVITLFAFKRQVVYRRAVF